MPAQSTLISVIQACLDCITLISVDCAGTVDVPIWVEKIQGSEAGWPDFFADPIGQSSNGKIPLRDACQMCERPVYDEAQISLEFLGYDLAQGFGVSLPDEMAEQLGLDGQA